MKIRRFLSIPYHSLVSSAALLLLRITAGSAFMFHGWNKIQAPASWAQPGGPINIAPFFQVLAALSEFGGGLLWVLGLLMPLASFGIACTMAVATYLVGYLMHMPFVDLKGGFAYELPALFLCIALLLLATGPGKFSLDKLFWGEKQQLPY